MVPFYHHPWMILHSQLHLLILPISAPDHTKQAMVVFKPKHKTAFKMTNSTILQILK